MLVAVAGTGLTFGLWWMYFTLPAGQMLHVHRELVFSDGCPSGLSVKSPQLAPALWSCQPWPASEWNTPREAAAYRHRPPTQSPTRCRRAIRACSMDVLARAC